MSEDGSALMRKSGEGFKAVLLALILGAAPAISAAKPEMTVVPTIAGVSVKVDGGPAGTDIKNLITIAADDPYSEKKIDAILKQVYQTGLFSDIHILKEGRNDVRLTFLLTRRLLVQNITIIGDKGLSRKKLQESLYSLRPDSVYTEEKLQLAAEELKEALRKEGYLNCAIKASREKKPAQPLVDVVFEVTAGRQFAIRSVEVAGDDERGDAGFGLHPSGQSVPAVRVVGARLRVVVDDPVDAELPDHLLDVFLLVPVGAHDEQLEVRLRHAPDPHPRPRRPARRKSQACQ